MSMGRALLVLGLVGLGLLSAWLGYQTPAILLGLFAFMTWAGGD